MYDLQELKAKTNCRTVAISLLGQPKTETPKRDLYPCPFHNEIHPSFWVYADGWRCYGQCAKSGSVLDLVMQVKGLDFKGACDYLGASQFVSEAPRPKVTKPEPTPPSIEWQEAAINTCKLARIILHSQHGQPAMRYLTEVRKLDPWVIWQANLGYLPLPAGADKQIVWQEYYGGVAAPCGVTLPAFDPEGQLWGVKVRLPKPPKPLAPEDKPEKYRGFKQGKLTGGLFGGDQFKPELPVYLDEGEFNALAVWGCQFDTRLFNPLALSSVNNELTKAWLDRLLFAPVVFVRTDAGSGDGIAEQLLSLSKRFVRVQVPEPYKDPNDFLIAEGKPALIEWVRGFLC